MKLESGLSDHMVLQRNRRNVSDAVFTGMCGANGPVKAWGDGTVLLHDPKGTNHGAAWGVFIRLERLGVPMSRLLKGPEHWGLPELLG